MDGKLSAFVTPGNRRIGIRSFDLEDKYQLSDAVLELDCHASQSQTIEIEVEPIEPENNDKPDSTANESKM